MVAICHLFLTQNQAHPEMNSLALICFGIFFCISYQKEESEQAKLGSYLEKVDGALEKASLSNITIEDRSPALGNEISSICTGTALCCRLPRLPTILVAKTKDKRLRGYTDLYIRYSSCSFHFLQDDQSRVQVAVFEIGSIRASYWGNNGTTSSIRLTINNHSYTLRGRLWVVESDGNLGLWEQLRDAVEAPGGLALLLSLPSAEAKTRFKLEITKDDSQYVYVKISPLAEDDKKLFRKAQVVVDKTSFLPRRLWYAFPDRDSRTIMINYR
jgi:hypothetical protein